MVLGTPAQYGIDMTSVGATGCTLYVDPIWFLPPLLTDTLGMCGFDLPVPFIPQLAGLPLEAQWIVSEPGTNPASALLSTAVQMRLGM